MIRLLIVEDHPVVGAGLAQLLEPPRTSRSSVWPRMARAVRLVAEDRPDVVLMDLSMPTMNGIEATKLITAGNDDVQVVVLTSFADREQIEAALDAGAIGYLLKDAEPEDVIRGVQAAARGNRRWRRRLLARFWLLGPVAPSFS